MCKRLFVLLSLFVVLGLVIPNVVFADVIEVRVAAGEDDAEERVDDGSISLGSSDLEITEEGDPVDNQLVGLRFIDIAIPQGVTITSAYVQFQVDETDVPGDNRPGTKFLKGEASDNPVSFTDAAFDISSRPTTSAEASWDWPEWLTEDEEGPDQQTSDISAVIQEIVDQAGWSAGNSLVLIITGSGENAAESFDGEAESAPLLHIEYIIEPANPGTDGLAAFYALDNDVLDSSGNGNDGTIVGAPTYVDGLTGYGMAMEFDGESYVDVGNGASLDIPGPISMSIWIRPGADDPEGQGTEAAVMAKADSAASPSWSWQVRYGWNSPQPYMAFTFNTSPRAWAYVGQNLEKDEWAHIACSHDGETLKCYLNGVETDSTPMGAITSSPAPVLIGSDGWRSDWIGALDEVAIYNRALSEGEIMYLAGQRVTPVDPGTDGLAAFYALDGDSNDSSGNGNDGTLFGDQLEWVEGNTGGALSHGGLADAGVEIPTTGMSATAGTVAMWGLLTDPQPAQTKYFFGHTTQPEWSNRVQLYMNDGDNLLDLGLGDSHNRQNDIVELPMEEWLHVALTWDANDYVVYLNGESVATGTYDGLTDVNEVANIGNDGSRAPYEAFAGLLDEVAIYSRALSAGEIRYLAGARLMDDLLGPDVTGLGDVVQGIPNDGDWPGAETPDLAFDDDVTTKYLHFKGDFEPDPGTGGSGLQITPLSGASIVTGLTLTTANDVPGRDPIAFELSGSNDSIDGPYTLIASGDIVDFAQAEEWPRFTMNATPITFDNDVAYTHYQLIFTAIRGPVGGSVNSMQIAEVELRAAK
ncbi:MAG: LamG domain-containing protein [Planctomycetes bacterium]|nr:LamG domain-containing protein [Planctomycetota bacterium]